MPSSSTGIDGLRIALEMERRGYALYTRAQQFAQDEELKELLEQLAGDEKRHYALFLDMFKAYDADIITAEENTLLAAEAADHFFPGGLMQMAWDGAMKSAEAMLQEAIKGEVDSLAFYDELLTRVDDDTSKATIREIIKEEESHKHILEERKAQLTHKE